MKSVPSLLFFKPMKEEPHAGIRKSPFVKSGLEDGHGRELKPPYRPGEKCYVREEYAHINHFGTGERRDVYKADNPPEWKGRPWIFTTATTARRFVTILSCDPVRVENVTREDCARLDREHLIDTSLAYNDYPLNYQQTAFRDQWRKRHPGKEWCWRVESEEETIGTN